MCDNERHALENQETLLEKFTRLGLRAATVEQLLDEIDSLRKQVAAQTTEAFTTNPKQERHCLNCEWDKKGLKYCSDCSIGGYSNFQPKQEIK